MLIETQIIRSKSELVKELQGIPVVKDVICHNVDRKVGEQIAKDNQGATVLVVTNPRLVASVAGRNADGDQNYGSSTMIAPTHAKNWQAAGPTDVPRLLDMLQYLQFVLNIEIFRGHRRYPQSPIGL